MFHIRQIRVRLLLIIAAVGLFAVSLVPGVASSSLSVDFYCLSLGHGRLECHAQGIGGTGGYTYTWQPTPILGSGSFVIIRCTNGQNKTVSVTVKDSSGATASASGTFFCGAAQ
jgi:hypothetical protein